MAFASGHDDVAARAGSATAHQVAGHELNVTACIGISIYPQDGADPQSSVKAADVAMYQAKKFGRNNDWSSSQETNPGAVGWRSLSDLARLVRYVARMEHR